MTRKAKPNVQNLTLWITLADSLIAKGFGEHEFSGRTLNAWRTIMAADNAGFNAKSFAAGAVKGIAAAWTREQLGAAADHFAIAFTTMSEV